MADAYAVTDGEYKAHCSESACMCMTILVSINYCIPAPIDSLSFKYSLAELFRKNWSNTAPIIELVLPMSTSP